MTANLELAVIGNCAFSALVDTRARIVWSCMPRFDSDPTFCALLGASDDRNDGAFAVEIDGFSRSEQAYRTNTAIVETVLHDSSGGSVKVVDFAPRFHQRGRTFRPSALMRQIVPLSGSPRVTVRLRPTSEYGEGRPDITRGSNHVRYVMPDLTLRLTTDAPVTYVLEEVSFLLETPMSFALGPDEPLPDSPGELFREFFDHTDSYWREWVRYLSVPFEWQEAVIRAAITLKLSTFEETGAVIAAPTTSVPEAPGSERNWDYRYCWLRDSFFVVHALNNLGVTQTMEEYLKYIMNIAETSEDGYLQPLFGVAQGRKLDERVAGGLAGYRGMGPVRIGNDAYRQIQNDSYGFVILSCTQMFFDLRLSRQGDEALFRRLEALGNKAVEVWNQPDAGIWELRKTQSVHTFSSIMCWAGCDRLAQIAVKLGLTDRARHWSQAARGIYEKIVTHAWNSRLNSFTSTFGGKDVDAVLLLLPQMGFVSAKDPRFTGTLERLEKELRHGDHIYRYAVEDDFGRPEVAFNACTFWYIDALALAGRVGEARILFENMIASRNAVGLLSEDIDTDTGELWGNFPQTYSMVGLINSAMNLSRSWNTAFQYATT